MQQRFFTRVGLALASMLTSVFAVVRPVRSLALGRMRHRPFHA